MRINWLSILRGWMVILVITFHSFSDTFVSEELGRVAYHIYRAFNFRMALFFFISGIFSYSVHFFASSNSF